MDKNIPRVIAFYLPQFHPVPENDGWWGKGFTEWTNVAKAKPLFKGHYQPHIPTELGFYDLRVPEVRQAQANLAREYGLEGFCYWHYWFAGKRLLEKPFDDVLRTGEPDFPFCLAWANQSWTGIWHGAVNRILIEQTYPGESDHNSHFDSLLPAFEDDRYIKVDSKPLFIIYKPTELNDSSSALDSWRDRAISSGLQGLFIVGVLKELEEQKYINPKDYDAFILSRMPWKPKEEKSSIIKLFFKWFGKKRFVRYYQKFVKKPWNIYDYKEVNKDIIIDVKLNHELYPCLFPNWDNTPRSGIDGYVLNNSSPDLFQIQVNKAIKQVEQLQPGHKFIFVKSWNEWAEGNHLEPDLRYGRGYLEAIRNELNNVRG